MKLFKRIYYPIMAALLVFMLVMGFVDASGGSVFSKRNSAFVNRVKSHVTSIASYNHNSLNTDGQTSVRNYLLNDCLLKGESPFTRSYSSQKDDDGNNVVQYSASAGVLKPTVFVQDAVVRQDTMLEAGKDEDKTAVDRSVQNIVVAIPGSVTKQAAADAYAQNANANLANVETSAQAVLITAHYDATPIGGAADAIAVSAMVENALDAAKNGNYKNDLFFVFTDASLDGGYGAMTFLHQLKGFNNGTDRIQAAANFDLSGTKGALTLYQTSDKDAKLIGKYAGINGGTFASSATDVLYGLTGGVSDFDVLKGLNALNFTSFGGAADYGTHSDTAENVSRSLIAQTSDVMYKFYDAFGNKNLDQVDAKSSAVFFSYLDVMTVWYPVSVAFVLAGAILGLLIATILVNRKKKAFSWGRALSGAFVQLLTVAATALALYVMYYVVTLILTGFGVLTLHSLSSAIFASNGLMVSAMIFAGAIAVAFYIMFKRVFAVKAADVVRGNVLLWALTAFIISFASPKLSYLFVVYAVLSCTVLLLTTIFRDKFKERYKIDIERLFLYVWPLVLTLPLFIPLVMTVSSFAPAAFLPLILALFVGLIGNIAPFADYLRPLMDRLAKKLPNRSVRYERIVTEQIEDRAKKGKFTEVTSKKIITEKVAWNYLNRAGIAVAAVLSAIMILLFTSFGGGYSTAVIYKPSYADSIYDDSMVFVWEKGDTTTSTIEVRDQSAYRHISYAVPDFKWDSEKKAYVKNFTGAENLLVTSTPTIVRTGDKVDVTTFDNSRSQITLTLTNASTVTEITFNKDDVERESETFTYLNREEIVLVLPYGYDNFSFTLNEGAKCTVAMEQHVYNQSNLLFTNSDWDKLEAFYAGDADILYAIRGGMVLKLSQAI